MENPYCEDITTRRLTRDNLWDISNWAGLSDAVFGAVFGGLIAPYRIGNRHFSSVGEVVRLLGIVLVAPMWAASNVSADQPSSGQPRHDDIGAGGGIVLAEVIEVSVVEIDGYDPGKLYGTISVSDNAGRTLHQLYNRSLWNTQLVGPGGLVDLDWPPQPIRILPDDGFFINVDLKDNYAYRPLWDPSVAHGVVTWKSHEALDADYDRIITAEVKENGDQGSNSVLVKYAVLSDAVVATVKITVEDDGEWFGLDVYGDVTAEIRLVPSSGESSLVSFKLFSKDRSNYVGVDNNTRAIGLNRNSVPAHLCSSFLVRVQLWDASFWGDNRIADGVASFVPDLNGSNSARIADSKVTVEVTWSV